MYQLLDGKGNTDILIISIYQCCKKPTNEIGMTAFHQQQLMLSELDRKDLDPCRNFLRDLKGFLRKKLNDKVTIVKPIILGDWNEECTWTSNSQQLCDEFGLIDVWASIHPGAEQVKTYLHWVCR